MFCFTPYAPIGNYCFPSRRLTEIDAGVFSKHLFQLDVLNLGLDIKDCLHGSVILYHRVKSVDSIHHGSICTAVDVSTENFCESECHQGTAEGRHHQIFLPDCENENYTHSN